MRTDVSFTSAGITIAGHLYTPGGSTGSRQHPAIIVGHPASGVKEQSAGIYARLLAEQGFITLAFDSAYQGGVRWATSFPSRTRKRASP
jgi:fermentation-respiration switch protein FrsA (DUF1100 family)